MDTQIAVYLYNVIIILRNKDENLLIHTTHR